MSDARRSVVLLVEDDALIRAVYAWALRSAGYRVLEAQNGQEAMALFDEAPGNIAAVVTDVVMPGMGGLDLAASLRRTRPDLKVLFVSGFVAFMPVGGADVVLQKPCTRDDLIDAVRTLLET